MKFYKFPDTKSSKCSWVIPSMLLAGVMAVTALSSFADLSGSLQEDKIIERLKPAGEVTVIGGAPKVAAQTSNITDIGQKRYEETCKMCHATGLAGAPKFGNKEDWAPRIKEGMDTVYQRALHGYKAMPPKGGCSNCSDEEIKKAVDYMTSHSK